MVARYAHADGFRLWPIFSAAALRRKVLEVLACGGGGDGGPGSSCRGKTPYRSPQRVPTMRPRSERLAELLRVAEEPSECGEEEGGEDDAAKKAEALEELKGVVAALQGGEVGDGEGCMSRVEAALAVRRKAKDDAAARETLAMLGAIPPLVAMLDERDGVGEKEEESTAAALYALLNLAIGNDANKAAIVKAGAVHKMLRIAENGAPTQEAVVANFLCLSALDANKPVIGCASGAAPFLLRSFQSASSTSQARHDALRALLNLSISPSNAPHLLAAGLAPALVSAVGADADASDRALAALCNLVAASPEARRAVSRAPDAVPVLVDALGWCDEPGCQEKAAYVLMVLAHRSGADRAAMAEAGAASALLELTLVGTALAQKRASRVLEILRADKGKQRAVDIVAAVSAPQQRGGGCTDDDDEEAAAGMSVEKRAVRQLVQQSLHTNMRRIVRRARLPQDLAPPSSEKVKALTASSTSKSLPF
ncbi:hypothetical protein PR202_gb22630 [Eleusine coracana subsp. coracana]|uniref:Uncharacterized protein n=1 Tax=Eleusine coracana subsp. coracana TaxID=191504 RepID=A0AAV5FE56_ELECO|nr:hypothetical protein QOZ80_6BG0488490 [Eleusine coracana subsp. coracana]GJN33999.1 hypothetical protein PR202_gb22630 [Eleusine coracana subsp. coracana]